MLPGSVGWPYATGAGWGAAPQQQVPAQPLIPAPQAGVALSPGTEPIPQKLVDKVRSRVYVDLKELLGDNISLLSRLESVNTLTTLPAMPGVMKPRLREITSLTSWMYCFLAYAALLCPDEESRERLAYARLIIREAQRHGGQAWLDYDKVFRQQAALDREKKWDRIDLAVQASTLLAHPSAAPGTSGRFCDTCHGLDHATVSCALAYFEQPAASTSTQATSSVRAFQRYPPRQAPKRRTPSAAHTLCISWNNGRCIYPGACSFLHVCSICFQNHPASECPSKGSHAQPRSLAPPASVSNRPNH